MKNIDLTLALRAAYSSPVAGTLPATGGDSPKWSGEQPRCNVAAFLSPDVLFMGAGRGGPQGSPVLHRSVNPRFGAHPFDSGLAEQTANGAISVANTAQGTSVPSVFSFESTSVRTFADDNGKPWFCAADVCAVLGYANSRQAVQKNCRPGGVSSRDTPTSSGIQPLTFINEGNLYRLIIKSRKPEAERFEQWVMEEVLPAIRKTGQYAAEQAVVDAARDELTRPSRRFMTVFTPDPDNGEPIVTLMSIPREAMVVTWPQIPRLLRESGSSPSTGEVLSIARACVDALSRRTGHDPA